MENCLGFSEAASFLVSSGYRLEEARPVEHLLPALTHVRLRVEHRGADRSESRVHYVLIAVVLDNAGVDLPRGELPEQLVREPKNGYEERPLPECRLGGV